MATATENFEIFRRVQPHEYIKRFLEQDVRPDGRALDQFRKTMITSGAITTSDASAMIRLGGTTVVCGIKAEVCEPAIDTPNNGYLVPNVELSPLCSPKFKQGPPGEKAQVISEFIHQLFIKSNIVPLDKLCIKEGKAVWVLHADIVCLNYDGNILDASLLALTTALKNLKLPATEVSDTNVVEADPTQLEDVIELNRLPLSSTFSVFNNPDVILSDPNDSEEQLANETVTVVMDTEGNLCKVYKNGGSSIGADAMRILFKRAKQRISELNSLINQVL